MGVVVYTIVASIIIMLQNSEQLEKVTNIQIKAFKESIDKQIKISQAKIDEQIQAIRDSTEKQIITSQTQMKEQIEAIKDSTEKEIGVIINSSEKQMANIQQATEKQLQCIQEATQKQIDAIKESTQLQIQSFVEQCQGIIAQEEKVVGVLATMSEQKTQELKIEEERKKIESERLKQIKMEEEQRAQERMSDIERLKPKISIRTSIDSFMLFWNHYWIHFINTGGKAQHISITCEFCSSAYQINSSIIHLNYSSLERNQQVDNDCGNIDKFKQYDTIIINVSVRDINERRYIGKIQIEKASIGNWIWITLSEVSG